MESVLKSDALRYLRWFSDFTFLSFSFFGTLTRGEHVHFIDGPDGGYAMAAVQLKAQMRAVTKASPKWLDATGMRIANIATPRSA